MKLGSKLPAGDANGLAAIAREMLDVPEKVHVAIILFDCSKIETEVDTGDVVATARIRRVEVIRDVEDMRRLRMLLVREYERRTGRLVLPFDMQEELENVFGRLTGSSDPDEAPDPDDDTPDPDRA